MVGGANFGAGLAAKLLTVGAAAILARILSEVLPPEEAGRLNLSMATIGLGALLLVAPLGNLLFARAVSWEHSGTLRGNLGRYLSLVAITAAAWALIPLLAGDYFLTSGGSVCLLAGSWWVYMLASSSGPALLFILNILGRQFSYFLISAVAAIAPIPIILSFHVTTVEGWLLSISFTGLFAAGVGLVCVARWAKRLPREPNGHLQLKDAISFSLPLLLSNPAFWAITNGWRYAIERHDGSETLAYVAIPVGIGISLHSAWDSLVNDFLKPKFLRQATEGQIRHTWNVYLRRLLAMMIFSPLACLCCHDLIGRILLAEGYRIHSLMIFWGCLAYGLVSVAAALNMLCHTENRPNLTTVPSLVAAGFSLAAIFLPLTGNVLLLISLIGGLLIYIVGVSWHCSVLPILGNALRFCGRGTLCLLALCGLWGCARSQLDSTTILACEALLALILATLALRSLYADTKASP